MRWWWLAAAGIGCGVVTDREPLTLAVRAGGTGVSTLSPDGGGKVELTTFVVTFSDLRLEEPVSEGLTARLAPLVVPAAAWAHPGHDYPGDVAAELLGTWSVDLLAPDVALGEAAGYAGEFATARLVLGGEVARLEGTWTDPDGVTLPFRFVVDATQPITDLPFEATLSADTLQPVVVVRFDVVHALSFVDWSAGDEDGDGVLTEADGSFGNTVQFGVVSTDTWSAELQAGGQ
jgi:hypothetical protein